MNVFNNYYKQYDEWYDKNIFTYLSELEAIKKVLPEKGKGLEIGVGTGRFASALGIKYGIDPSKKMLEIAEQRGIKTKLGCGEKLPYKNSSFDYVVIIITLCFVQNPEQVMREAKRVLKNKGKIIIGIVDKNSFLGKIYRSKKSMFYAYAKFYTVNKINDMLKKEGFGNFLYYQTIYNDPKEIFSLEKSKKGFGEGGFVIVCAEKKILNMKKIRNRGMLR